MPRKKRLKLNNIFRDKNGKFKYMYVFWAAIAVWACYVFVSQQINLSEQKRQIAEISSKIEAAEQENKELNSTLSSVGTDEYVESVARQNLGYTKSNEQVFVDSSKAKK